MTRRSTPLRRIVGLLAPLFAFAFGADGGRAQAEGLTRIANCRIVDDRGPIKALGVNYVDGFWSFARDGKREAYLPALDALADAKIPFVRMAFGPWSAYKPDAPATPEIADFVMRRERYYERFDVFLADLRARRIAVVLNLFWDVDPYTVYFHEPLTASADPDSRTSAFLREVIEELARRYGADPAIWLLEFTNEGNLGVDYPHALHTRREMTALARRLAGAARAAGDPHLISSGNAAPRPAAQRLAQRQGWRPDDREEFLDALDDETANSADVVSVHLYPEDPAARPWDGGDVLNALPVLVAHAGKTCRPLFIGEFGASDPRVADEFVTRVTASDVQLAAIWGFGRPDHDPLAFRGDATGRQRLRQLQKGAGR
jgi:hypothetical protein